jgi:hypothetical protein
MQSFRSILPQLQQISFFILFSIFYARIAVHSAPRPPISLSFIIEMFNIEEPFSCSSAWFCHVGPELEARMIHAISVADPGCLSRIPYPDPTIFWYPGSGSDRLLSRFPDPDPGSGSYKYEKGKIKLTFFMHEKVKIEVIFLTKFNFSCFSPFLKVKS